MAPVPARAAHQRQRIKKHYDNNSVRRTYDLVRFALPRLDPEAGLAEDELVATCSASRNTIRTVLRSLAEEGLIRRRRREGTTCPGWMVLPIDEVMKFGELEGTSGVVLRSVALETLVIPAPAIVRDRLNLPIGALVLVVEGMLCDEDDVPLALTVSYLALDGSEGTPPLPRTADPVAFLEDELGVVLGPSTTTVGAMSADTATAHCLGIPEGAALLWFEDVLTDTTGQPRALSQFRLRGDRIATSATVRRRTSSRYPSTGEDKPTRG